MKQYQSDSAHHEAVDSHRTPVVRHPAYDVNQRPFIVIWEVTRACDLACVHCRASAMPSRNPFEVTGPEAHDLIDQVAAFGPPAPLFVLTGGDPLKRPDLLELISYASSRKLPVALSPSATPLLTRTNLDDLKRAGLRAMSLSVDGASAEVHDAFRGIDGVFDRTLEAWDAARAAGLKVQINTTVARRNVHELPKIAEMALARDAFTWSVFFLVPMGRGLGLEQISPRECEDVMNFLYDVGTVIPVKTTEGHHYKRIVLSRNLLERLDVSPEAAGIVGDDYRTLRDCLDWTARPGTRRTPMDVNAGRGFVFISHTGSVHPSGFLPLSAGNVKCTPLGELYRESPLFEALRDSHALTGRCGRCEFAPVCGGSRSRAYAASADPLGEDPLCAYQPGSFPYQRELSEMLAHNRGRGGQVNDLPQAR
jgi:radical SAM protein